MSGLTTIVLLGVVSSVLLGARLNQASSQRLTAFGLCKEWYEQMKGSPFTNVTTTVFSPQTVRITNLGGLSRVPIWGQRSCTILATNTPPSKLVTIQVQWSYQGRDFEENLQGVIYDRVAR